MAIGAAAVAAGAAIDAIAGDLALTVRVRRRGDLVRNGASSDLRGGMPASRQALSAHHCRDRWR